MATCQQDRQQRTLKRGGPRRKAGQRSEQLTEADCRKVLGATEAAWAVGRPLNRFITLAWELGGIDPAQSVAATGAFIKLAREWMGERGFPMPWVWVQETGPTLGAHCHALLHVPPEIAPLFRPMPRRWAHKVLGGVYFAGVVDSQRISSADACNALPAAYEAEVIGKVHYMLKCAPAALEGPLGMIGRGYRDWEQSCPVYGKRAGVWQGWKKKGARHNRSEEIPQSVKP